MNDRLIWERDGRDWPNHAASRFVKAAGLRWHVQQAGEGPVLLLVHGTGAATHSWRALLPMLVGRFTIIAPDLPGHGFTDMPPQAQMSLPGMALALRGLLETLGVRPAYAAGHSAGAAILTRMCLDGALAPDTLVSLNGALLPFTGVAGQIFAPMAKALFHNPFIPVPKMIAWFAADRSTIARLLRDTGSKIDTAGVNLYARLFGSPGHVAATLAMMANWDLAALRRDLPRLQAPLVMVAGGNDRAVPCDEAYRVRELIPGSRVVFLRHVGHLAHEERPREIADLIMDLAGTGWRQTASS